MITFFPTIYPDETIYSVLSRAYEKSGYLSCTQAREEFFEHPKERIDFLFTNRLKQDIVNILTINNTWDKVIEDHTLYNYYGRFLNKNNRKIAYTSLYNMNGNYNKLFSLTPNQKREGEYIRYCPLCAKEDRINIGETYWRCAHQIPELTVCHIHGCRLLNSDISKNRHVTTGFFSADALIKDLSVIYGKTR